ncbi:MAG: zinc-ribbon domain-containing protein [Anaerolineales bacterium]
MIIFGSRRREIELSSGQFHCPKCDATRAYKRKRAGKYFTLYFIPLFQFENLGEYIVCQTCQQAYKPEVLAYKPPSPAEKLLRAVRSELETGLPLHMAQQKLIAAGMAQEAANRVVEAATAGAQVKCSKCGFTYLGTVKLCANCGTNLAA